MSAGLTETEEREAQSEADEAIAMWGRGAVGQMESLNAAICGQSRVMRRALAIVRERVAAVARMGDQS
jgi:L-arabinose isomerase